jgi:hypothetical protein
MVAVAETEQWRQHSSSGETVAEQWRQWRRQWHLSGSKQQGSVSGRAAVAAAAERQSSEAEARQ